MKENNTIFFEFKIIKLLIFFFLIKYFINKNFFASKELDININIPKISIFLPIHNKDKYLKRSINSLQKQTLREIEIIPINDGSTDNSLNILKNLEKQDSRIKIINNKNNSGLLFSRGMGILNSKGEYIMCLDPDDQIRGPNDLKYLYNKAKTLNLDIISFNILYVPKRVKSGIFFDVNRIIKQPELYQNAFDANGYLIDFYITNKLVKNKLFKNAFQIFKKYIYGKKWNFHEDNIWSILIYKYSNSYLFVNKIIYIYYQNNDSLMENRRNDLELENLLMRHEIYKEIFKNKGEEKYLIAECLQMLEVWEKSINIISNNSEITNKFINEMKEFIKEYQTSEEFTKIFTFLSLIFFIKLNYLAIKTTSFKISFTNT